MIFCREKCLAKLVSFHSQTVDGLILEKPTDKQDAYHMLSRCIFFSFFVTGENLWHLMHILFQELKYIEMNVFQVEW